VSEKNEDRGHFRRYSTERENSKPGQTELGEGILIKSAGYRIKWKLSHIPREKSGLQIKKTLQELKLKGKGQKEGRGEPRRI